MLPGIHRYMKIGPNTPCPCSSGHQFKDCCGGPNPPERLPPHAYIKQTRDAFHHEKCFHPESGIGQCTNVIKAHTVQRKTTLESLVNNQQKLLTFQGTPQELRGPYIVPREVGWRVASTFNGFCGKHDTMFQPVEVRDFQLTKSNCFLLMFRSLCFELYQKEGFVQAYPVIAPLVYKRFQPEVWEIASQSRHLCNQGAKYGLGDLQELKSHADTAFLAGEFSDWHFQVLDFEGEACIAATGGMTPNFTVQGQPLLGTPSYSVKSQVLLVAVVKGIKGPRVVFGWHAESTAAAQYVKSVLKISTNLLPSAVAQIIFAHIENTFFSHNWWQSMTEMRRLRISHLATCDAFLTHPGYTPENFVPWRLLGTVSL